MTVAAPYCTRSGKIRDRFKNNNLYFNGLSINILYLGLLQNVVKLDNLLLIHASASIKSSLALTHLIG